MLIRFPYNHSEINPFQNKTVKSIINPSALAIIFTLLMFTCSKNSDEEIESAQDDMEAPEKIEDLKRAAIADWNEFLKEARLMVSISESNLYSLKQKARIVGGEEGSKLSRAAIQYEEKLEGLKTRLERRNDEFYESLIDFENFETKKNKVFEKSFRNEMVDMNLELEKLNE